MTRRLPSLSTRLYASDPVKPGLPAMSPVEALEAIRDLHCPAMAPLGMRHMGPIERPCEGCEVGDPWESTEWPCETRKLADAGLAGRPA